MKYFESKNAPFCRNFYQIALLFLKNPVCKLAIFISQNLFHKNLNNLFVFVEIFNFQFSTIKTIYA